MSKKATRNHYGLASFPAHMILLSLSVTDRCCVREQPLGRLKQCQERRQDILPEEAYNGPDQSPPTDSVQPANVTHYHIGTLERYMFDMYTVILRAQLTSGVPLAIRCLAMRFDEAP